MVLFRRFADLILRHRVLGTVLLVAVTLAALLVATRVRYDFRPEAVFAGDDDLVQYSQKVRETFGTQDDILVVVEAIGRRDVFDPELLTWQWKVSRDLWRLDQVRRVDAAVLLRPPRPSLIRGWRVGLPLVTKVPVDADTAGRVRDVLDDSRLAEGTLVSRNRRLSTMVVITQPELQGVGPVQQLVREIRKILSQQPLPFGFRIHLTGLAVIRVEIVKEMQKDQATLVPMLGVWFFLVLTLVYRSPWTALLPLVAVGMGVVWLVGALTLMGQSFNIISNALPLLLLILGISSSVHVLGRYFEEIRRSPNDRHGASRETITYIAPACLLASFTTAVGFLSIVAARSASLKDFGWHAGLGMILLFISTMCVLGISLPWLTTRQATIRDHALDRLLRRAVATAGRWVVQHPWPIVAVSLIILAASLGSSRSIPINSYLLETFGEDHPTSQTLRLVEDQLAGVVPLEICLTADEHQRFLQPRNFNAVHEFAEYAQATAPVTLAQSYVDVCQEVYRKARRSDPRREELPSLDADGQHRIQLSERIVLQRLARTLKYSTLMTEDGLQARILLRTRDAGTREILEVANSLEQKLGELFPAGCGIVPRITGDAYVSAKAMDRFIRDLFYSLAGAAVVIFFVIGLLFRSARLGLVTMLPNLTPLAVTLGYMWLRGFEMNAANVIVFSISLGIAVDDTIHFLARFLEETRRTTDIRTAIRRALDGTGKAILLTTFLIISGLAVMLLSSFLPTRRLAELISVSLTAALVGDLLLLPACLLLIWPNRTTNHEQPVVHDPQSVGQDDAPEGHEEDPIGCGPAD